MRDFPEDGVFVRVFFFCSKIINLLFKGLAYNTREHFAHFKSRLSLIVRVNVVPSRTVVVDSDWRFLNPCGSHLQESKWVASRQLIQLTWYHQLTWYNSPWLWRWLPHRLSKRQSLWTTTVLFRTTFIRTIKLNLLLKWLLGSNLSQHIQYNTIQYNIEDYF